MWRVVEEHGPLNTTYKLAGAQAQPTRGRHSVQINPGAADADGASPTGYHTSVPADSQRRNLPMLAQKVPNRKNVSSPARTAILTVRPAGIGEGKNHPPVEDGPNVEEPG